MTDHEQQDYDDATWHQQMQDEQRRDEEELRLIRHLQEARELNIDKTLAFADNRWELAFQKARLQAEAAERELFMAGYRQACEDREKE